MPNQTPNYNLVKPLTSENYDVNVFNGNADIIDSTLKDQSNETAKKIDNSKIVNNLITTEAGFVLDARQAKALKDYIDGLVRELYSLNVATAINSGDDLNDYNTFGNYFCASGSIAGTLTNCPANSGFTLKVERTTGITDGTHLRQMIILNSPNPTTYLRNKVTGTFGNWQKVTVGNV
ncbi:hypothetical protein CB452P1_000027 [Clostridium phage CB452P1]|nr:hypothetical protein CB452P1_000027 [Clostridium phage CB452P1]